MTWSALVKGYAKKCFYHCSPGPSNDILACLPNWSIDKKCRDQGLRKMLQRCPDLYRHANDYRYPTPVALPGVVHVTRPHKRALEHFVDDYCLVAYDSLNDARNNLTRGVKRVFFTGPTSGEFPNDPTLSMFGTYQIAMGSLAGDTHSEVLLLVYV
jgi:hypothetical protein